MLYAKKAKQNDFSLLELHGDSGLAGYGECSALFYPWYNEETTLGAIGVLQNVLIPSLFDAYEAGDPDAKAIMDEYAMWASSGIVSLQAVLDLERYAIGGGISARPETTTLIRDAVDHLTGKD